MLGSALCGISIRFFTKSKVSLGKNLRKRSITRVLLSTDLTGPGGGPAKLKIELLLSSFFHFEDNIMSCNVRGPIKPDCCSGTTRVELL